MNSTQAPLCYVYHHELTPWPPLCYVYHHELTPWPPLCYVYQHELTPGLPPEAGQALSASQRGVTPEDTLSLNKFNLTMSKSGYRDIRTIKKHARELRRDLTDSEKILWEKLRNR